MDTAQGRGWRWGRILAWLGVLAVVAIAAAFYGWTKFFREQDQPDWVNATPEMRFKYGSIGAEHDAGIPYWIFYVLPRIFPDKLPGPGGYAALGVPWEQGQELPVGFTKKTIGFARVANNCAVCHTTNYRGGTDENPVFVVAGPGHTLNVEAFFRFLVDCAKDPRFNADILMAEINLVTPARLHRPPALPLSHHPDHQETPARARGPVRLDLPQGLPGLGARPRRRDEPDQVLHDQVADGRHLRPDRHARRCGT